MGKLLYPVLALPMHSVAKVSLSSLKQVLAEIKHSCLAWFSFLHPHLLLDTRGCYKCWEEGKVPRIQVKNLHVSSSSTVNLVVVFNLQAHPKKGKSNTRVTCAYFCSTKMQYKISHVKLPEVAEKLYKYLRKGEIRLITSLYGAPCFFKKKEIAPWECA